MEIESFNQLFAQAKAGGYKIDGLNEDTHGYFRARWRRGGVMGPEVERRLVFNACLDAYLACKAIVDEETAGADGDLFG